MSGGTYDSGEEEFTFVHFMECTELKSVVGNLLGCVCLRWNTTDE